MADLAKHASSKSVSDKHKKKGLGFRRMKGVATSTAGIFSAQASSSKSKMGNLVAEASGGAQLPVLVLGV